MKKFWLLLTACSFWVGCGTPAAGPAGPTGPTGTGIQTYTVTFREGENGYSGTLVNGVYAFNTTGVGSNDFSIYTSNSTANISRVLVEFPIYGWVPNNVTVRAASISAFINGITSTATIGVHAVNCLWTAGTNWNNYNGAAAWGNCAGVGSGPFTAGVNFSTTAMSSLATATGGTFAWSLSPSVVQTWLNSGTNKGVVFTSETEGADGATAHYWMSSPNDGTVQYRPVLTIEYTIP